MLVVLVGAAAPLALTGQEYQDPLCMPRQQPTHYEPAPLDAGGHAAESLRANPRRTRRRFSMTCTPDPAEQTADH